MLNGYFLLINFQHAEIQKTFFIVHELFPKIRMGRWETSHVSAPPLMSTIFPNSFLPSKKTGRPVPVPPGRW